MADIDRTDIRTAIHSVLKDDAELLTMLAQNYKTGSSTLKGSLYSIVPAGYGPMKETPYLLIRIEADDLVGTNMYYASVTVRCYNAPDKTYVEIDKVLARVKALLHRRIVQIANKASLEIRYETSTAELEDQGWQQNFRESQYRIVYL